MKRHSQRKWPLVVDGLHNAERGVFDDSEFDVLLGDEPELGESPSREKRVPSPPQAAARPTRDEAGPAAG